MNASNYYYWTTNNRCHTMVANAVNGHCYHIDDVYRSPRIQ